MNTLINLCGKYRKWIYLVVAISLLVVFLFPFVNRGSKNVPYFCFDFIDLGIIISGNNNTAEGFPDLTPKIVFSTLFFCLGLLLYVLMTVRAFLNKKSLIFPAILFFAISFLLRGLNFYGHGTFGNYTFTPYFNIHPNTIYLFVLCGLNLIYLIVKKIYSLNIPTIKTKVADKVKSHKSKSERIEELERQNAEIQRQLDELKRKD